MSFSNGKSGATQAPPKRTFHPLANLFPYLTGGKFQELVEDIRRHGLIEPIVLYEDMIIDGRNRYRACLTAKVEPRFKLYEGSDPAAFVISANIYRRHLTAKQKRDLIAKVLKASPEKSDRQIAETVKASPTTVGKMRTKMETAGDVSKLDTRQDSKGRKQPARRKTTTTKPLPVSEEVLQQRAAAAERIRAFKGGTTLPAARDEIGPNSKGEVARLDARIRELESENHRLNIAIGSLSAAYDASDIYAALVESWDRASDDERQRFMQSAGLTYSGAPSRSPIGSHPLSAKKKESAGSG